MLAGLACMLVLLGPAHAARELRQVGYGQSYGLAPMGQAIITDMTPTSSVGVIDSSDKSYGDSQAAAYARGASRATGLTALSIAVANEGESGGAHAAADAIRRQAGYQGSSIAGDMFTGESTSGASPAEDAIRRTQADNAMISARMNQRARPGASPFDF